MEWTKVNREGESSPIYWKMVEGTVFIAPESFGDPDVEKMISLHPRQLVRIARGSHQSSKGREKKGLPGNSG